MNKNSLGRRRYWRYISEEEIEYIREINKMIDENFRDMRVNEDEKEYKREIEQAFRENYEV